MSRRQKVEMRDARCPSRECYAPGLHYGTFVQGRGYTRLDEEPRMVCRTRDIHGCPSNSKCPRCGLCTVDEPGVRCPRGSACDGVTVAVEVPDGAE